MPGTSDDVTRRIALASSANGRLREPVLRRGDVFQLLKMRLFRALVTKIGMYGPDTWTLRAEDSWKCFKAMRGVTLRDREQDMREQQEALSTITNAIRERRLRCFGHAMRRQESSILGIAYRKDFTAMRPRGRPPKRWKDQIHMDTGRTLEGHWRATGGPLEVCEEAAQEREAGGRLRLADAEQRALMACALKSSK